MTLANQPHANTSSEPQKRSWLDVILRKPEPEPPPAPTPPVAKALKVHPGKPPSQPVAPKSTYQPQPHFTPAASASAPRPPRPSHSPPKPPPDVTDLLVMSTLDSTLDQKAPPVAAGTADLLDDLVQDHLARASMPGPPATEDHFPVEEIPPSPQHNTDRLQREIESLLAGDPLADAPIERARPDPPPLTADPFADFPAAAPPIENIPDANSAATSDVTNAELEVLLKDDDKANEASAARSAVTADAELSPAPTQISELAPPAAQDEVESQLSAADGVLAEELAQLMAEPKPAAEASATIETSAPSTTAELPQPEAESSPTEPQADLTAAVQSIMNNPVQLADKPAPAAQSSPKASPEPAAAPVLAAVTDVAAEAVAEAVPQAATEGSISVALPEMQAAIAALESPPETTAPARPNIFARTWNFAVALLVMILQILDMPFGWIKEPDKNVLGIAAFCLLLGGVVLKVLSIWMQRQ